MAPLGGVGPSEADGTGPAEGCCPWWSSVWTGDVLAGLSKHIDLKLVSRLEFASGAVAMRYEPRR